MITFFACSDNWELLEKTLALAETTSHGFLSESLFYNLIELELFFFILVFIGDFPCGIYD